MTSNCNYIFKSGKRRGERCEIETSERNIFCKRHIKKSVDVINNASNFDTIETLQTKLMHLDTTLENKSIITKKFRYITLLPSHCTEYQKNVNWLRNALNFPYNTIIKTPVDLNSSNEEISNYVSSVYNKLDSYIYGMNDVKEELMSFVCKRISNPESSNHILALQGNNGVGKTRMAHGLAQALDLPIRTINLGSVTDVSYFTGHSFTFVDSEVGRIVQILNEVRCKNCIIYFDELDKIHETSKGQSIYSFLTHLIDTSQNEKYQDMYLSGINLDLSKVFFIFSFNDENLIDKTVKDRLKILYIKDPSIETQIEITNRFIIPEILKNLNFTCDNTALSRELLHKIISNNKTNTSLRYIRKIIDDIFSKLNIIRMLNNEESKKISFYNNDIDQMINNIINQNIKKEDDSFAMMYM
jgi:ATP-dependent Lon protease